MAYIKQCQVILLFCFFMFIIWCVMMCATDGNLDFSTFSFAKWLGFFFVTVMCGTGSVLIITADFNDDKND